MILINIYDIIKTNHIKAIQKQFITMIIMIIIIK